MLTLGIPVGGILLAPRLSGGDAALYALVLLGIPVTMAAWAIGLSRLNRAYMRRFTEDEEPEQSPLELSIPIAVVITIVVTVVWLLVFGWKPGDLLGPFPD